MNGLPMGAPAPAAPEGMGDEGTIDVSQLDLPAMLMEKLNIDEAMLMEMVEALKNTTTGEEAAMVVKQFDRNPETMNEPYEPAAPAQAQAPAPAGLPVGQ